MPTQWRLWREALKLPHYGPKRAWLAKGYYLWPLVWFGNDEWCNKTLVIRLPLRALVLNLHIPMRTTQCDDCKARWLL